QPFKQYPFCLPDSRAADPCSVGGELDGAEHHFERAIGINPQSADSLYNLGLVLEGFGRSAEAIARFNSAALINPQHDSLNSQ
ncbi:MAG: tetratricopeptide repeat protein, partial [Lysobacterales bacterium]